MFIFDDIRISPTDNQKNECFLLCDFGIKFYEHVPKTNLVRTNNRHQHV